MLQFLQCNYSAIDEFRWIFLEDVNWKYICDRSLWYHNWQLMGISSDRLKETFSVLFICKRDTPWSRTHAHLHLDWVRKYKTCGNGVFIARFHKYNFELINDAPSSENMNHRNEFQKETKMSEVLVYYESAWNFLIFDHKIIQVELDLSPNSSISLVGSHGFSEFEWMRVSVPHHPYWICTNKEIYSRIVYEWTINCLIDFMNCFIEHFNLDLLKSSSRPALSFPHLISTVNVKFAHSILYLCCWPELLICINRMKQQQHKKKRMRKCSISTYKCKCL